MRLRRVVVHAFPVEAPEAVVLVDVSDLSLEPCADGDPDWLGPVCERLATCDVIAAQGIREVLRGLGFDPGERRLADLIPPQKSLRLNRRGRTLKITLAMLVRVRAASRALSPSREAPRLPPLRRPLAPSAPHGGGRESSSGSRVRAPARRRPAPLGIPRRDVRRTLVPHDETHLRDLCELAAELGVHLEVVAGSAPGWADPWARMRRCRVERDRYDYLLWDDEGRLVDDRDVQLARLETVERTVH